MDRQGNSGPRGGGGLTGDRRHHRRVTAAMAALLAVAAFGPSSGVLAADNGHRAFGDVSVFASALAPGHPFGIAVDDNDRVYVSTSAGDFFAGHQNSDDERVFTYDGDGNLINTTVIDTAPNSDMGLFGLALDGNSGTNHKLYVADMNGRILRLDTSKKQAAPEVFSQVPASSGLAGDWMLSMWNDLVFDTHGNLYVPDDKPRIWKVSPDGTASIWVTDPRLAGFFGFAGGPLGGRIDPSGQWLYVSITVALNPAWTSQIWRIRLVDHPTASDIELVHEFPFDPTAPAAPQATGLAFSKAGNLYVSLIGSNEIAVLDPSGSEIARISDPRFHSPWGLAFSGKSLLVTNGDLEPGTNPDAWKIFKVYVGETGLPVNRPKT
jgi:sugar lactone lactonase YvrE